ncbi:WXG100 family type VII secretion target [Amycolatopsis sp. NPDC059657]|uniref:WXG100 family type VII secretion target n=1 Tax=Amycolatopsis sp. NPDC059657 TaxID=3346899 RepID=UPI003670E2BB
MAGEPDAGNIAETASEGVNDLASAATGLLGPIGDLAKPLVDALNNVWEGYFGSPTPPDGTNWNAYTHEQLYQMLWDDADVGDVSAVAAEWDRHGTELTGHGETLRDQRASLKESWSGQAAERAADRLGELSQRTSGIGNRAATVGEAAQGAGDALATARNTMPPPPGDALGPAASAAVAGAGAGAAIGAIVGAGAGGVGAGPGALIGAAIGAVAAGGASLFLADVAAAERKAEAVHVMQRYEESLRNSSDAIAPAGSTKAKTFGRLGADETTSAAGYTGGSANSGAGLSWGQATGAGLTGGLMTGGGLTAALAGRAAMAQLAAARAAGNGGMMPGHGARAQGEEEKEHKNRMPVFDQPLLDADEMTSTPVIGL